jgi:surfeit locus 1 family protein
MSALPRFAPHPLATVLTLLLAALCVRLGWWQWQRGVQRELEWRAFAAGAQGLVDLGTRSPDALPEFQRVQVLGVLDGAHQFLLDNRSHRGVAGYEVLTPLLRPAAPALLIDRGWVAFTGSRARLPDVSLAQLGLLTLTGRTAPLPGAGLALGRAAPDARTPWPRVTSFPTAGELAAALGKRLPAHIVLLDPAAPHGYVRDWQPPGLPPLRHFAYAIQWGCFAGLALILWAIVGVRRARARKRSP